MTLTTGEANRLRLHLRCDERPRNDAPPGTFPCAATPHWEALLNDPKNTAPLL
jgi:hypothetical protein